MTGEIPRWPFAENKVYLRRPRPLLITHGSTGQVEREQLAIAALCLMRSVGGHDGWRGTLIQRERNQINTPAGTWPTVCRMRRIFISLLGAAEGGGG